MRISDSSRAKVPTGPRKARPDDKLRAGIRALNLKKEVVDGRVKPGHDGYG